jgi:alpha-tubulin suppressor-like RCC1 family protein
MRIRSGARVALTFSAAAVVLSVPLNASGGPAPPRIVAVDAGASHTCALTSGGGVKCWGYGAFGRLGNGVATYGGPKPVDVKGLSRGVKAISAGGMHTCVVTTGGRVKCWGSNPLGQLGNGGGTALAPVDADGLGSGIKAVTAGGMHTCALTTGGGVKCWGSNSGPATGTSTYAGGPFAVRTPADVSTLKSGVGAIVADGGNGSTNGFSDCALTSGGGLKCWGGFTGHSARNAGSLTPVDVLGLTSGVKAVAVGGVFTCALTTGGTVKCWGSNSWGNLGNGTSTRGDTPVDVVGLPAGISAIAAGARHAWALTGGGGVKCWGFNNRGQLGNGKTIDSNVPVDVVGLGSGVKALTAGFVHTCALLRTGTVKCWGWNGAGELGNSAGRQSTTPVDVRFGTSVSAPRTGATAAVRTFVDRLDPILAQSAAGRRELGAAISSGLKCSISRRAAASRIARVVDNRNLLLRRLAAVSAPTRRAAEAITLLRLALQHSIEADRRYRDGFLGSGASRCPLPRNASFAAAARSDALASAAKRRFVAAYNPLARQVNRRTWSANKI